MKLHHLKPAEGAKRDRKRVGRGRAGVRGKTAGRGTKGWGARHNPKLGFEGGQMPLQRRVPKLKGFTNPNRDEFAVVNVETLARLALAAGGRAPRSALVSVSSANVITVLERDADSDIASAVAAAGHARGQALLLGGYGGSWLRWAEAADLTLSGPGLGAGVVVVLPEGRCGLARAAEIADWLAAESAGQCGPCVFGLPAMAGQVEQLAEGRGADTGLLRRWLGQVDGRGGCAHPGGAVRMLRSALRTFGPELSLHAGGRCSGTARVLPIPPGGVQPMPPGGGP